jgi:hypothetical protein
MLLPKEHGAYGQIAFPLVTVFAVDGSVRTADAPLQRAGLSGGRSIVRDEEQAEDVMPQAYVNAFTHLRQFNGSAPRWERA